MSSVPTSPGIPPRDLPRPRQRDRRARAGGSGGRGSGARGGQRGRGRSFDPWELQLRHGAGHLAAWLLELERLRPTGSSTVAGARVTDGAAPLIGSSVATGPRHKIERVPVTDFTVLIDGETGSQAHPHLGV
jgi:hypothetical protein